MSKSGASKGSNNFGGRRLDICWQHFIENNKKEWTCKHCKEIVSKRAERMRNHLKACKIFQKINDEPHSDSDTHDSDTDSSSSSGNF